MDSTVEQIRTVFGLKGTSGTTSESSIMHSIKKLIKIYGKLRTAVEEMIPKFCGYV